MPKIQQLLALLCVALLMAPFAGAQTATPVTNPVIGQDPPTVTRAGGMFSRITRNYEASEVSPMNVGNSTRLDALIRGGNLYISLQDAIALALENNLDIEVQRYGVLTADADIQRAKAGGALRGVTVGVQNGPSSATSSVSGLQTGIQANAASQASSSVNSATVLVQQTGSAIPQLDPAIQGYFKYGHNTTPQSNTFVTGTTALVRTSDVGQIQYSQGFLTGTNIAFGYADVYARDNIYSDLFNPSRQASLTFNFTQHLLQGWGIAVNNRYIRVAKNNREAADLQFKTQVIATVDSLINLYWDLVSFNDDVKAKQQSLAYNQKLYNDNKKQVEIGTLAPIEIVRAEAAVASSEQDLTIALTRVLQQETLLKSVLSRNGVISPLLSDVHVIPTDRIRVPDVEPIQPFQDMVAMALHSRPELAQSRIAVTNAKINLKGSKSQLLPTLDLIGNLGNNGLVGAVNTLPVPSSVIGQYFGNQRGNGDPFFLGGYGTLFSQLFGRNFPDYGIGLQLNIPIRNRAAQADYVLDQITYRQQQLSLQRAENNVQVEVQNAIIGLQQARVTYQAAVKTRYLQEQTLDAEQKKLNLGASTIFNVILVQRDLATAQSAEVAALSAYSKAKVDMYRSTGQLLEQHNVSLAEAYRGKVSTAPSTLPEPISQNR